MSSPRDWEGIELLRQIFSQETDHELDGVHTNYLQPNSSKATAEAETRTAKQKTQGSQSWKGRFDHADRPVRPDDLVIPAQETYYNCLKTNNRSGWSDEEEARLLVKYEEYVAEEEACVVFGKQKHKIKWRRRKRA